MKAWALLQVFVFLPFFFLPVISGQVQSSQIVLSHHVPAAVARGQAKPLGQLPATQRMNLSIVLPLRNQSELASLLKNLYDPSSVSYRHFLSVKEFTDQFGPTVDEYQKVLDFATAHGFEVHGVSANRLTVTLSGSVGQVEQAFQVKMQRYKHPTQNREFFSPDREPSVPAGLAIRHIAGLNNYALPKSMAVPLPTGAKGAVVQGSGPGGNYMPSDMRTAYGAGTALTGQGQTIGLVQFDGYDIQDVISAFNGEATLGASGSDSVVNYTDPNSQTTYSIPVHNVLLDGATGAPGQFISPADDGEQVLDIAQSIGMAPGLSQIRVYIGNNDVDILGSIASEDLANEVSISWAWAPDDPSAVDQYFEEMAAQGQSVFVASGDYGAYSPQEPAYFPAEDPWVTAVGGTDLTTDSAGGAYTVETAWNRSGGGVSPDGIAIPIWQSGVANSSNQASATLRNIPDVAMEAGFDNYNCNIGNCSEDWAGTSFASPRWAAFIALVNQQGVAAGDSPVGFLNPSIYETGQGTSYGSEFHDIDSGETNYEFGYGFYAIPGYDLTTGWGSPTGPNLINALAPVASTVGFHLTTTKSALTLAPGTSASTTIGVVYTGGFSGNVSLAVTSALPSGVTASFSTNPTNGTSVLTLTASVFAQPQSFAVTITGTSDSLAASAYSTVNIPSLPVAVPAFSVASGTYSSTQTVAIFDTTPGAIIYYTTNGTAPTASSTIYSGPITVSASEFLEAMAVATGYSQSPVATVGYYITPLAVGGAFEWTWMSGNGNAFPGSGVYGTLGIAAAGNVPGGRYGAGSWTDSSGNFWLFGGYGFDANGTWGWLNDLWMLNSSTNQWTWMGGSNTVSVYNSGQPGVYGTLGTPAPRNIPGGRFWATTWTDQNGHLWLFGGSGFDSNGTQGYLNDLWEFNPVTSEWTWMGGGNTDNQPGAYGTLQAPAAGNIPGARNQAAGWIDTAGNLWLFGGYGYYTAGNQGELNDLWKFNLSTNEWTWMGGSSNAFQSGVYGTLGTPAPGNIPGSRTGADTWTDQNGQFWLYGGASDNGGVTYFDLWKFNPSTNEWAWMNGGWSESSPNTLYGLLGTPAAGNSPGPRFYSATWVDADNNLWLLGGLGGDRNGLAGSLNDLWEFQPSLNEWTWMGGSSTVPAMYGGQPGVYGTLGTPAPGNIPGGRSQAASWTDASGNLWLFGGSGYGVMGCCLNDLWKFQLAPVIAATPTFSVTPGTYTSTQTVAISDSTPGAAIYYTTNGTTPTTSSTPYGGPVTVSSSETIEAIATASGYSQSAVASAAYTINLPAATPTFSVTPGTYSSVQTVSISDSTPGAVIYYTTNGVTPTKSSTPYGGPITVSASETLQAVAIASGYSLSSVASAAYTINLPAATPTFGVAPGTYTSVQTVAISDSTPNAAIYYTTNGLTPTTSSTPYSGPITVSASETLHAVAIATGYSLSPVASAAYTINLPAATPTFSVAPGTYTAVQTVAISDATPGAAIYYTTSGSTPTTSSTPYSGPIPVSASETLQAVAIASGSSLSPVASASYTINLPAATPTFSVQSGTYTSVQTVSISDSTAGATIYYTTNGVTPTTSSTPYSGPITVNASETLQAVAIASGYSLSPVVSASYTIIPPAAMPVFSVQAGTYTSVQTVTISDATPSATIFYTTNGSVPSIGSTLYSGPVNVSTTETINAIAVAANYSPSPVASVSYTINLANPAPAIASLSPAYTASAGSAFTLTVNGSGFISGSTIYWGGAALATQFVSSTQLTAQVPASDIASAGTIAITVSTPSPGGGTSAAFQFEVDSATSGSSATPNFTSSTATVSAGNTASYPVTLSSSVSGVTVTCLNLPAGASCSYSSSSGAVSIATSSNTPAGKFQVTAVFNETQSVAANYVLAPLLLLPLMFIRRRLFAKGAWITVCMVVVMALGAIAATGCGAGGSGSQPVQTSPTTEQVTSSGVVTLTVK